MAAASASTTAWRVVSVSCTATRDIRFFFFFGGGGEVRGDGGAGGGGSGWGAGERGVRRRGKTSEQRSSVERGKGVAFFLLLFLPLSAHAARSLCFFLSCSRTHLGLELVLGKVEDGPCESKEKEKRDVRRRNDGRKNVESKRKEEKEPKKHMPLRTAFSALLRHFPPSPPR